MRPEEHAAAGEQAVAAYAALPGMGELGRYGEELRDVAGRAGGPGVVLVAVEGDELLGNVTYYRRYADEMPFLADKLGDLAGFRMLATVPQRQGRGVGEALTRACMERARGQGAPGVALHTTELMAAGQRLYRRLGFDRWPDADLWVGRDKPVQVLAYRLVF